MAGKYKHIDFDEMHKLLQCDYGFRQVELEGTTEHVYGKIVAPNLCLRVYTSIVYKGSRGVGEDAIRVCLVYRRPDGEIKGVGRTKRVYRIDTWKKNLCERLDRWTDLKSPDCLKCNSPMALRKSKHGEFWGCCDYPNCKFTRNV